MTGLRPLAPAILQALAQEGPGAGLSLPRLSKRLGHSASTVLRELSFLSDAALGGQRGPGWVRVWQEEGRWMAVLTDAGRAHGAPEAPGTEAAADQFAPE